MDLNVKIVKILDAQSYVSKTNGKTYVIRYFVGEVTNSQYPKIVAFKVMGEGEEKFNAMGIVVGGTYNVSFDVESREWNGKYFTECQAWKAVRVDVAQAQNANNSGTLQANPQPQPQPQPAPQPQQSADDVPF